MSTVWWNKQRSLTSIDIHVKHVCFDNRFLTKEDWLCFFRNQRQTHVTQRRNSDHFAQSTAASETQNIIIAKQEIELNAHIVIQRQPVSTFTAHQFNILVNESYVYENDWRVWNARFFFKNE